MECNSQLQRQRQSQRNQKVVIYVAFLLALASLNCPAAKVLSSCPENTILSGVNYLKGQAPILAKKDEDYPPWLWDLLKPKTIPNDGPGGKGEKMRLRAANRARIKEQNFMKTQ